MPQSSKYSIRQSHDAAVLATQFSQICARRIKNSERNVAVLGRNEVPFPSSLQLPPNAQNNKAAARSGTTTLSNGLQPPTCCCLTYKSSQCTSRFPFRAAVLLVSTLSSWYNELAAQPCNTYFVNTVTIRHGAESGTDEVVHRYTRKSTHVHGPAT